MTQPVGPFAGFGPRACRFFKGLAADNSKQFWLDQQSEWEEQVRGPMAALLTSFPPKFHPFKVYRMHRDIRFSKDKSPYKLMHGAMSTREGGSVHYVHVDQTGLLMAAGMYILSPGQLARFREAVADDRRAAGLTRALASLEKRGISVGPGGETPLKTAPRGYPVDHPRVELLRQKGLIAVGRVDQRKELADASLSRTILTFWKNCEPMLAWLDREVGPAEKKAFGSR